MSESDDVDEYDVDLTPKERERIESDPFLTIEDVAEYADDEFRRASEVER